MAFLLRAGIRRNRIKVILLIPLIIACVAVSALSFATETAKYQVVAGSDDKAYLVDTTTGYVWVLTYRTLATGREPIAIPYKFIKIAPKGYPESLIENVQGVSMPPGGKP
ncbi:MAG TPA: hypothetical protein VLZ07_10535 [Syntrophales bacterium]|nr:hypothetical protein [Syntrophales bacterium]